MKHYIEQQLRQGCVNHALLLGVSGSGKSHAAKLEIKKSLTEQKQVFLLDMQHHYTDLTEQTNANTILISSTEDICLFAFSPMSDEENIYASEFRQFCFDTMYALTNLLTRPVTHEETNILLRAIVQLFAQIGINEKHYTPMSLFPNLGDFLNVLAIIDSTLYQEMNPYRDLFSARQSAFSFHDALNHLSISLPSAPNEVKALLHHAVFLHIKQAVRKAKQQAVVVLDEATSFLISEPLIEQFRLFMIAMGKKFGLTCLLVQPSLTDLLTAYGEHLFGNIHTFVCFRQDERERGCLKEMLSLYDEQLTELTTFKTGQAVAFHGCMQALISIPST